VLGAVVVDEVVVVVVPGVGAGESDATDVASDAATVEPFLFVAVTMTRTVEPTSLLTSL